MLLTDILPVALNDNAPVDLTVTPVPTKLLVLTLPPVTLPVAETMPVVNKLPAPTLPVVVVILPVAFTKPVMVKLPTDVLPVTFIVPDV